MILSFWLTITVTIFLTAIVVYFVTVYFYKKSQNLTGASTSANDLTKKMKMEKQGLTENRFVIESGSNLFNKRVLRLVNQKDTEMLTTDILKSIKFALSLEKVALLVPSPDSSFSNLLIQGIQKRTLTMKLKLKLNKIVDALDSGKTYEISQLDESVEGVKELAVQLEGIELYYLSLFPISKTTNGLLIWEEKSGKLIGNRLDNFRAYAIELFENADSFSKMKELSYTDSLTGLSNYRYFNKRLGEEINRCKRYKRKLSLVFFDLDGLKQINDKYGHLAGDEILRKLASIIKGTIRSIDIVARYGGDEFCIIMPEVDEDTCRAFMNRLKREVQEFCFTIEENKDKIKCSISLGAAIYPAHATTPKKLIYIADMALLKAKESGKNSFLIHEEEPV